MGGTNYSSDNASSATISKEQETQLDTKLSIGLSLYYSIYIEEELDPSQKETMGDQIKKYGNGYMNFHSNEIYEGTPVSENVSEMEYRYVDCSNCKFNIDTGKVDDYYMMKKCLDRGLNDVYNLCINYDDNSHTSELIINIGGYDLIEELVGITKYILTGTEPKKGISDKKLKSHAKKTFKDKFQQLKTNGWHFKVVYTCIYSASESFGDGEESKKQAELKNERSYYMMLALGSQKGSAANTYNKTFREGLDRALINQDFSTGLHLIFGMGSLCIFCPPFALICLAADLTLHIIECFDAISVGNKQAAVDHCKGAMLDIVFIIPYGRIGKFLKRGILKAEVNMAERASEKSTAAFKKIDNSSKVTGYKADIKRNDARLKSDRENYVKEHSTGPEDRATIEAEARDEVIFKSELDLMESQQKYSEAAGGSFMKYRNDQARLRDAKLNYNNYVTNSENVAKNFIKLKELAESLKKEWNDNRFISIRSLYNATNTGVTIKGNIDNSIALGESLARYDDRIVVTSEDFTFCEVLKESATSFKDDFVNLKDKIVDGTKQSTKEVNESEGDEWYRRQYPPTLLD